MASDAIMHYEPTEIDYNDDYPNINSFKEAPVKRKYYTSNSPDSFIKNAITGSLYPYKVGSNNSRRLFKIVDATGNYDNDGVRIKNSKFRGKEYFINSNSNHLYYNTPEECTRHMRVTFQPAFIEQWNKRRSELFSDN
jgi:hypothetical protein